MAAPTPQLQTVAFQAEHSDAALLVRTRLLGALIRVFSSTNVVAWVTLLESNMNRTALAAMSVAIWPIQADHKDGAEHPRTEHCQTAATP